MGGFTLRIDDLVKRMPSKGEMVAWSNPMSCSALDCGKLAGLGYEARYGLAEAAFEIIGCLGIGGDCR